MSKQCEQIEAIDDNVSDIYRLLLLMSSYPLSSDQAELIDEAYGMLADFRKKVITRLRKEF